MRRKPGQASVVIKNEKKYLFQQPFIELGRYLIEMIQSTHLHSSLGHQLGLEKSYHLL
ncbi:hypothetical protein ACFL27_02985 [candidate division CSSED10-310 bacterium]|uniref:Uncharacterized protein n=1 Tax=candidate division CSSED10-310 bacterium TaxID=2855610 RepID=A0ABV6YSI0_UNCC1